MTSEPQRATDRTLVPHRLEATGPRFAGDPESFWAEAATTIDWMRPPSGVFDPLRGPSCGWFPGALINPCFNAVDRHVQRGRGSQPALIYDSPLAGAKRIISYNGLLSHVQVLGSVLRELGVSMGDRVFIDMPMLPETVVAMLATARIGAVPAMLASGSDPQALAACLDDAKAQVVLTASCDLELNAVSPRKARLDEAIAMARMKPESCLVLQRPQGETELARGRDLDWAETVAKAHAAGRGSDCVPVEASHPLHCVYEADGLGRARAFAPEVGVSLVAFASVMREVGGVDAGDVFWAMVDGAEAAGRNHVVHGPLTLGCTTLIHEGHPVWAPDAAALRRVIGEYRVAVVLAGPEALGGLREQGAAASLMPRNGLRRLLLADDEAERDPIRWAARALGVPTPGETWRQDGPVLTLPRPRRWDA